MKQSVLSMILLWSMLSVSAQVRQGRLDLRSYQFTNKVKLSGQWDFFWMQLLRPDQISAAGTWTDFPALWNGVIAGDDTLTGQGYATYRLKIDLPSEKMAYGLFMEDVYCAYQLYANGELVASNGQVGKVREQEIPHWRPQVVYLGEIANSLELVLQISNFHHSKGGLLDHLYFGLHESVLKEYINNTIFNIIIAVLLLLSGSYFLVRYGFFTRDQATLFYALFCIFYIYRIIGSDYYVLHGYFPNLPWGLTVRLEYISLYASVMLFNQYIFSLYPEESNKKIYRTLMAICILYILSVLVTDPIFFTRLIESFFVILIACFYIGFNVFVKAVANDRPGAWWGVGSAAIVFAVFAYQIFTYFLWLAWYEWIISFGMVIFLFLQVFQLYTYRPVEAKDYERIQ